LRGWGTGRDELLSVLKNSSPPNIKLSKIRNEEDRQNGLKLVCKLSLRPFRLRVFVGEMLLPHT
jgi:hypothetical protein